MSKSLPASFSNLPYASSTSYEGHISCNSQVSGNIKQYDFHAWKLDINSNACKVYGELISSNNSTSIIGFFNSNGAKKGRSKAVLSVNHGSTHYIQLKGVNEYKFALKCHSGCNINNKEKRRLEGDDGNDNDDPDNDNDNDEEQEDEEVNDDGNDDDDADDNDDEQDDDGNDDDGDDDEGDDDEGDDDDDDDNDDDGDDDDDDDDDDNDDSDDDDSDDNDDDDDEENDNETENNDDNNDNDGSTALFGGNRGDKNGLNGSSESGNHHILISLSPSALGNIWCIVLGILFVNIFLFWCHNKTKNSSSSSMEHKYERTDVDEPSEAL